MSGQQTGNNENRIVMKNEIEHFNVNPYDKDPRFKLPSWYDPEKHRVLTCNATNPIPDTEDLVYMRWALFPANTASQIGPLGLLMDDPYQVLECNEPNLSPADYLYAIYTTRPTLKILFPFPVCGVEGKEEHWKSMPKFVPAGHPLRELAEATGMWLNAVNFDKGTHCALLVDVEDQSTRMVMFFPEVETL